MGTKPETAACVENYLPQTKLTPFESSSIGNACNYRCKTACHQIEIENIRGVKADGVIDNLLKRGLIRITGRKEGLGRPLLYGVTEKFMHYFGIKDSKELEELMNLILNTYYPKLEKLK